MGRPRERNGVHGATPMLNFDYSTRAVEEFILVALSTLY